MLDFDLISQEASQSCESFQELSAFRGLISHELNLAAVVLVMHCQPFWKTPWFVLFLNYFQHCVVILVLVELWVVYLVGFDIQARNCLGFSIFDLDPYVIEILKADDLSNSTRLDKLHSILNTIHDHAVTYGNMIEEPRNQSFFLHELDVGQSFSGFLNCLVESILKAIGDIDDIDHLDLQSRIEHLSLIEIIFEVSTSRQDQTSDITSVVSDEGLSCHLTYLSEIVVTLLFSETGETH